MDVSQTRFFAFSSCLVSEELPGSSLYPSALGAYFLHAPRFKRLRSYCDHSTGNVKKCVYLELWLSKLLMTADDANRISSSFLAPQLIEKYMDSPEECLNAAGLDANPPSPVIASSSLPNPSHIHSAASGGSSSDKEPPRKSRRTAGRASLSSAPTSSHSSSTNLLKSTLSKAAVVPPAPENFECPICCLDFEGDKVEDETLALACGHRACRECWNTYLEGKIKSEGESVRIQCLEDGCGRVVSERVVEGLVNEDIKNRSAKLFRLGWGMLMQRLREIECAADILSLLSTTDITSSSIGPTSMTMLPCDGALIPSVRPISNT